jgi:hypothetical protein
MDFRTGRLLTIGRKDLCRNSRKSTELVDLQVIGPLANRHRALEVLKEMGFVDPGDSIPWREAFHEYRGEDLPGVLPINEGTNLPAFLFGGTDVGQEQSRHERSLY